MDYQRDEHHVHLIVYHLIWCPKRRRKVLVHQVGQRCNELIRQKCDEKGWTIVELAIQPDHIHLFVRVWPSVSAADVVKECQGFSAFMLRKEFPELHKLPSLWTRSYFASTAGNVSSETIQRYIAAQSTVYRMGTCSKTYTYKLVPTAEQAAVLLRTKALCNWLYNTALAQRITAWKFHRISLTCYQQQAELPDIKDAFPEFKDVHSLVLQDVLARLDRTYQAFFARIQRGEKAGFPRFKGANRFHSFTYKQYGNGAKLDNGFLVLSKIGRVKVRWSRPLEGTIKTVTISQEADGWYVCFACVDVPCEPLPVTGQAIGIDMGLKAFLTPSEGLPVANPRWFRKAHRKLKWHQQHVARCKKGSNRRKKAVAQLAKCHQRVRRQRLDFQHKEAIKLVRQNDILIHEQLQVRNMVKNRHLAKSISDAGWAQFLSILSFKAACAGREVIVVPAHYTTQDCSGCGTRVPKSLSIRTHICPECGLVMDRDENAALNIKRAGLALRGYPGVPG